MKKKVIFVFLLSLCTASFSIYGMENREPEKSSLSKAVNSVSNFTSHLFIGALGSAIYLLVRFGDTMGWIGPEKNSNGYSDSDNEEIWK